ncbi:MULTISPECIES: HD-GYP domain-containing protein [unclassified Fusibacter]|uniref:HD-GYP domain-containing protein n=1 Tax=unclassified Fusibacter TaxID=2624464 RepID=UPI00101057D1|nr:MULTISPECIES: HD-GYP domain-containing protein [unclassified Fusibacter]MCK8060869.1 HD domain-containing protein [Fusibacter sp. A2]NPE23165.1 HD domain-containing protein [Fusibacter sp. A1]RXV59523.1 HD domain-containing protein [Fusibacter sp. A1]
MRLIPIEISQNFYLAEDVYDVKGSILIKKGAILTDNLCTRVKQNGISSVYINDKYSQTIIEPLIPQSIKYELTHKLKSLFDSLRARQVGKSSVKLSMNLIDDLLKLIDDLEYEIAGRPKNYIDFIDIKSRETYSYEHSVYVAVLSYILGKFSGLNPQDLRNLLIGAIFHDIGMAYLDETIFMKNGKLDLQEFVKIKEHPQLGYEFIKNQVFANSFIKVITLQHHERLDGSGYPNKISGDEIHRLPRYVAITDIYDAMTSDRPYSNAVPAHNAIDYLMGAAVDKLDYKLTKKFIDKIMPYPVGTIVKLTNGVIAVVDAVNENMPRKPVLRRINETTKDLTDELIKLEKEYSIEIESVVFSVDSL